MGCKLRACSLVLGALVLIAGILVATLSDGFMNSMIKSQMVLKVDNDLYNQWLNPPINVYMSFRLFNLKNGDDFVKGAKPMFEEIGPFVYQEFIIKDQIKINDDNSTISYREIRRYQFMPDMSPYPEDYPITTVNMAVATAIDQLQYDPHYSVLIRFINLALYLFGEKYLVTQPVRKLLFGYDDTLVALLFKLGKSPISQMGFFVGKNNSADGIYNIHSGVSDSSQLGNVLRFNYQDSMTEWATPYANMLNGSDGTLHPPAVNKSDLYIFNSDLCRSLYLKYNETITTLDDIELMGFKPDAYFFADYTINPDNAGFCTPAGNCLGEGLLNLTQCVQAPIIMSSPHFLFCNQSLVDAVYGLSPDFEKHITSFYLEPKTGVPMKANKRIQFNTLLRRDKHIGMTKNVPEIMYPLFWVDEHFAIDQKNADKFYKQVKLPLLIITIAKWVLIALGCAAFSVSALMLVLWYRAGARGKRSGEEPLIIAQDDVEEANGSGTGRQKSGHNVPTTVKSEIENKSYEDHDIDNDQMQHHYQQQQQQQQQPQQHHLTHEQQQQGSGSLWPDVQTN